MNRLKEKFRNLFKDHFYKSLQEKLLLDLVDDECEKITDDFAIKFTDWVSVQCNKEEEEGKYFLLSKGDFYKTKELLEIFKKEKGYV